MTSLLHSQPGFNLIELNPYAPRPFVFSEVALCLRDSILKAGYQCKYCVNQAGPYDWSIVLGAKQDNLIFQSLNKDRVILFNFEQLESNSVLVTSDYLDFLLSYPVFDYHSKNIEFLLKRSSGPQEIRHFELPIVPSPDLIFDSKSGIDKNVDIIFFGSSNPRRKAIIEKLRERGLTVESLAGSYAQELAPAILRAKLVLHIHFYDTALVAPLRFLQPLARQMPILSEQSVGTNASDWTQSGIEFVPYDDLVDRATALLNDSQEQDRRIELNNAFIQNLNFSKSFEQALTGLGII